MLEIIREFIRGIRCAVNIASYESITNGQSLHVSTIELAMFEYAHLVRKHLGQVGRVADEAVSMP